MTSFMNETLKNLVFGLKILHTFLTLIIDALRLKLYCCVKMICGSERSDDVK